MSTSEELGKAASAFNSLSALSSEPQSPYFQLLQEVFDVLAELQALLELVGIVGGSGIPGYFAKWITSSQLGSGIISERAGDLYIDGNVFVDGVVNTVNPADRAGTRAIACEDRAGTRSTCCACGSAGTR